jgi:hypothetical protein
VQWNETGHQWIESGDIKGCLYDGEQRDYAGRLGATEKRRAWDARR